MEIIGKSSFGVDELNRFLRSKGCPEYANIYREFGGIYGVRWDVAIFQSCVETGFWKFGGDIVSSQNNFGGLGAVGGGEPGASFPSVRVGICAQIQHLATYAGVNIPFGDIVYDRTNKLVDWNLKGTRKTWESLSGQWAADKLYSDKIMAVLLECTHFSLNDDVPSTVKTFWCNTFPTGNIYLMQEPEGVAVEVFQTGNETHLLALAYEQLSKKGAGKTAYGNGLEPEIKKDQTPKPIPPVVVKPSGKKVRLDPGHSERYVGARGKSSSVQEEDLNRYQAGLLKAELEKYGIQADIYDPIEDDLYDVGYSAKGYHAFVSLHLNAFDKREHYTCTMLHSSVQSPNHPEAKIASDFAIAVANSVGNPVFAGTPGWPKGVMATGLGVLRGAVDSRCPIAFLSEAFFVDAYSDVEVCKEKCRKAMAAGAKVLADALKR